VNVLSHHSALITELEHIYVDLDEFSVVNLLADFLIFSQIVNGAENLLSA